MNQLKYFFEGPFNQDEEFSNLEKIIQNYKNKENLEIQKKLISELYQIMQSTNYIQASQVIQKYGNRKLKDLNTTEKFIHFLYARITNRPTDITAEDFTSVVDEQKTFFLDKPTGTKAIQENLSHNAENIALWLMSNSPEFKSFIFKHKYPIGCGFLKNEEIAPYFLDEGSMVSYDLIGSKIILEIDSSQDLGFRIVTAYPIEL